MATLHEIRQHLGYDESQERKYTARLYYDPQSDNANVYVKIDGQGDFVFAFDHVSKGDCSSKYVKYNGAFIGGISGELFMPIGTYEEHQIGSTHWQFDIDMDNGESTVLQFPRINHKKKGLQGTTQELHIDDILKSKPVHIGGWK